LEREVYLLRVEVSSSEQWLKPFQLTLLVVFSFLKGYVIGLRKLHVLTGGVAMTLLEKFIGLRRKIFLNLNTQVV
jgi:hypothetical protein